MRINPLRIYDELEINTSIEEFENTCKVDKTTYSFVRSLNDKYERKLSTEQKPVILCRDMLIECCVVSILLTIAVVFEINPIIEILWKCCHIILIIFNIIYTISMCVRCINDAKNMTDFYNKPTLSMTTGEIIGLIRSRYNVNIPIVKYEINDDTYVACPNMYTNNNELESEVVIIYDNNDPHKFFIEGSSYHQNILVIDFIISILCIISTIIILIL